MTLLSCENPETIILLIEVYPEFCEIYREGYEICLNAEKVMDMFSKELYELDRNTVQYMIDEQQEIMDAQKEELNARKEELNAQKEKINAQKEELDAQKEQIDAQKKEVIKMKEDQERAIRGVV